MNTYSENLLKARDILGSFDAIGTACGGISGKAVMKWRDKGRPPRTEYSGETKYSELIEKATKGEVKSSDLLPGIRKNEQSQPQFKQ